MPDSVIFDLHSQLAGVSVRSDRRFSVFELFRTRFGDSVFPGIICWHQGLQSYAPDTCEPNHFFSELELNFSSFVKRKGIRLPRITNTTLKGVNDSLHFTRRLRRRKISRNDYIDFLVDSLQKRWDDGLTTPGYLIADMLNHYVAFVDLQSQTALFDLLEAEYGVQLCCVLLPSMHIRSRRERRQNITAEWRNMETDNLAAHFHNITENWPLPVPQDVKNRCIREFRENTCWPDTFPCAVCSRDLVKGEPLTVKRYPFAEVDKTFAERFHFDLLAVDDAEHRPECVEHPVLRDCMVELSGCVDDLFNLCVNCENQLKMGVYPNMRSGISCSVEPYLRTLRTSHGWRRWFVRYIDVLLTFPIFTVLLIQRNLEYFMVTLVLTTLIWFPL